mmetsp:Transcript_58014/g.131453  ORF Transcript_58014/g.131453 Transcript_58014/m.131453 type:complete len:208 (+) Transcript_58014:194-817(+)
MNRGSCYSQSLARLSNALASHMPPPFLGTLVLGEDIQGGGIAALCGEGDCGFHSAGFPARAPLEELLSHRLAVVSDGGLECRLPSLPLVPHRGLEGRFSQALAHAALEGAEERHDPSRVLLFFTQKNRTIHRPLGVGAEFQEVEDGRLGLFDVSGRERECRAAALGVHVHPLQRRLRIALAPAAAPAAGCGDEQSDHCLGVRRPLKR